MSTNTPDRHLVPVGDAAQRWHVSPATGRRLIARGDVYAERVSPRTTRVDLNSLRTSPIVDGNADD